MQVKYIVPKIYHKICLNPRCNKEFDTDSYKRKYCSEECAKIIHQEQKYHKTKYINKPCEYCGKEHDHSYGSGRFCSKHCRMAYINRIGKNKPSRIAHLIKIHNPRRKHIENWICTECNEKFRTREELKNHLVKNHNKTSNCIIKHSDSLYECYFCHRQFNNIMAIKGHLASCPNHPNKTEHDKSHTKSGQTYHERCLNGIIKPSSYIHKLSKEAKEKISRSTINRIYDSNHIYCRSDVKYYDVQNTKGEIFKVRGKWELTVANKLNKLNIDWDNKTYISYETDITRTYHPDFHLRNSNIFIEVKGFYTENDKLKMKAVLESNPNIIIYFLHSKYNDFKDGKLLLFEACTLLDKNNVDQDNI